MRKDRMYISANSNTRGDVAVANKIFLSPGSAKTRKRGGAQMRIIGQKKGRMRIAAAGFPNVNKKIRMGA